MGSNLSLVKKLDKKQSDKVVWKCGCDPCKCDPCECANDDRQNQIPDNCPCNPCKCNPCECANDDRQNEIPDNCPCNPCKCNPCKCDAAQTTSIEAKQQLKENSSKTEAEVEVVALIPDSVPDVIITWSHPQSSPIEVAVVNETCHECTCNECNCVECGSKECNTSKACDVSALAAKFNPDIQETHLKCLTQNGCPCNPCPCYPFKCKPQQLNGKAHESPKQDAPPLEQLTEELEKLTVEPSVELDAMVTSVESDACTLVESQPINGEEKNGVVAQLN